MHTPTQELVLEVLAARHRLGEGMWTFSNRPAIVTALRVLESAGLVGFKSGVIENTYLAWLTKAGQADVLTPDYVPPIKKNLLEQIEQCVNDTEAHGGNALHYKIVWGLVEAL